MDSEPSSLIVLVHGFMGNPKGLSYMASKLQERYGTEALVYISTSNAFLDGVMQGVQGASMNLTNEILKIKSSTPSLKRISFVGISYGGIISRHVIAMLYSEADNSIAGMEPHLFVTFVTPHLGVKDNISWMIQNVFSYLPLVKPACDTLFLRDELLYEMSKPESLYMKVLGMFKKRVLYGNLIGDSRVTYQSACIYPFQIDTSKYKGRESHVVEKHLSEKEVKGANEQELFFERGSTEYRMARNLRTLSWDRIDCYFEGWLGGYLNHHNITVAYESINSIGKDVIEDFVLNYEF